jgi:GMP synthase (glutamine-hydrolysing)
MTVGVMGDDRSYEHVSRARAVTSTDGMTASLTLRARLPRARGHAYHQRGINRVVYDVTFETAGDDRAGVMAARERV